MRMPGDPVDRRCLLVVGAVGYGKTAAVQAAVGAAPVTWLAGAPDAVALARAVPAGTGSRWIVLDDLPRLDAAARALHGAVLGLPAGVQVALVSRWPQDAVAGWRSRGGLTVLGPADLALCPDAVADLLATQYGLTTPGLAGQVHAATAGWPALVHLAAAALAGAAPARGQLDLSAAPAALAEPGGALASYVADEILAGLPAECRRLLRDVAPFAPVTAGLGEAFGYRRPAALVEFLCRVGLVDVAGGRGTVPVIAAVAGRDDRAGQPAARAGTAANWYATHGLPVAAADAYQRAGDHAGCARALLTRGAEMLGAGSAKHVVALVRALPAQHRPAPLSLLLGDALRTVGDIAGAQAAYETVAGDGSSPAVAWRLGIVRYLRGEPAEALAAFARAAPEPAAPSIDGALLLTWTAAAQLMCDAGAVAVDCARQAVAQAAATGDQRTLAACHITLALALGVTGDPASSDAHYATALGIAERAGDLVLVTRTHTNRAHRLLEEARYPDALDTARLAAAAARAAGHANLLSIATCNEAQSLARLGRHDEAIERYHSALRAAADMGSRRVATALLGLADTHRWRGWPEQARAAYEEAIRISTGGDSQILVAALAGLARVLAGPDPEAAAAHADEAVRLAAGEIMMPALLGRAHVASRQGDLAGAAAAASRAAEVARRFRQRAGLAEALELLAGVDVDPARARVSLVEAYGIWRAAGAPLDADRVLRALGRLAGASTDDRLNALLAGERLGHAGALTPEPLPPGEPIGPPVEIRVFGRFEVLVAGRPLPASAWQSRKARDLLRILVARRGRPTPRAELSELLWPDDDATRTGHRLSVLLSIVRQILDPDRRGAGTGMVVADAASIALDIRLLHIDVELFLADIGHAMRLRERHEPVPARSLLTAAVKQYSGDAFEDDPYADWARPLRDEARAAYLRALRALAGLCRAAGDTEEAVGHLRGILALDAYDEAAHRAMVEVYTAAGRHGEARRAYRRYVAAMDSIGVRPPAAAVLRAR
jgi:DNA-binding SARP family transcriptional activator